MRALASREMLLGSHDQLAIELSISRHFGVGWRDASAHRRTRWLRRGSANRGYSGARVLFGWPSAYIAYAEQATDEERKFELHATESTSILPLRHVNERTAS